MEKRLGLAIALCVGFMLLWNWMFPAAKPQPPADQGSAAVAAGAPVGAAPGSAAAPTGSPAAATAAPAAGPEGTAAGSAIRAADVPAATRSEMLPAQAVAGQAEEEVAIRTSLLDLKLTSKGARVTSWILRGYKDAKGAPLDLVSPAAHKLDRQPLDLALEDPESERLLREALYKVERKETTEEGHAVVAVTFTWSDGKGNSAAKVLRIVDGSYLAELQAAAEIHGRPMVPAISWGAGFEHDEDAVSERMRVGSRAVVSAAGRIDERYQDKIKPGEPWGEEGAIQWAGLESKYFAAILVPQNGATARARAESVRLVEEGREQFHLVVSFLAPGSTHYHLFVGPKDYDVLKGLNLGLEKLLDFGYFSVIALPLFYALKFLHGYVGNYGWAIVIVTVAIRMVFFPFMHRSQLKMRLTQEKMKRVQPKLKALKEKYQRLERKEAGKGKAGVRAGLRQKQNEEMMQLYKDEGINPFSSMSGCLPQLVQLPILWAFYNILTIAIELRQAPFIWWLGDLSIKDPTFITPILMGGTMLAQQLMTASAIPDPAQRRMMYMMPIMFTWFFVSMPSGLVLYWLVNNLLGIVQQYLVNKEADARQAAGAAAA
jgi:YidC/Oxa1 family membrane protein insertase